MLSVQNKQSKRLLIYSNHISWSSLNNSGSFSKGCILVILEILILRFFKNELLYGVHKFFDEKSNKIPQLFLCNKGSLLGLILNIFMLDKSLRMNNNCFTINKYSLFRGKPVHTYLKHNQKRDDKNFITFIQRH